MKIVFFGTPDFAIPPLKKLVESEHTVAAVVTAPDKERGRGRKVKFTAVKEFAIRNEIPVLQPAKLKDEDFIEELKYLGADLFVIVAFRILPTEVFTIPPKGSFNLHGSLLPKYRGAAPIQWALINGDTGTGLTTFFLKEKVDTGNIILQESVPITGEDDFGTLHDKMSETGADLVLKTVNQIENESYTLLEQDDTKASPAPKITKEICKIDWNSKAEDIRNLIRGLSPVPGAYFEHKDKIYKIYKAQVYENITLHPGDIYETKSELMIGCGDYALDILEIQPEGKRRMEIESFLRGNSLEG